MNAFRSFQVINEPVFHTAISDLPFTELAENEVLVKIAYSDVNYKDALAMSESGQVIRTYPMTPGIDLSGTVVQSKDSRFSEGDLVLATGFGLGVTYPGGYSQYQKVPGDWLVPLPKNMTLRQAMIFGTAGFTAMLCVNALIRQGITSNKKIVVTGASGGVGSVAVALLHKHGFQEESVTWLKSLGASQVVRPDEFLPETTKALGKQQIDAVIDTVGGEQLSSLLPLISYNGVAALCGNAGGIKLNTTVLPFILRNIQLIGIDSVNVPIEQRPSLWQQMADLQIADDLVAQEVTLEQLPETATKLLAGTHQGRTLVNVGDQK